MQHPIKNSTSLMGFHLLSFFTRAKQEVTVFMLVLVMYLLAVLGNLIIAALVCLVTQLHTPMYFFLCNLSAQDIVSVSTVLPKLLYITVTGDTSISFPGCITQMFLFVFCIGTEFYLLTSMAYDRYVAICIPLRYTLIMNKWVCVVLATSSWFSGAVISLSFSLLMSKLSFCKVKDINHFFCDPETVLNLSCSDTTNVRIFTTMVGAFFGWGPFILILTSYICIISTILKIRTSANKLKAFSSCSSHLMVVILYYGTSLGMNMKPKSEHSHEIDNLLSILYIAVVPVLNPLVYSLRNKDVLKAMLNFQKNFLNCRIKPPIK
ncbi:olfactory receptor 1J4-like [Bombina bombina]|uniref:olfactory receptor 1J4-like n=1 Tax=Bombina bombina TaxID=8345 RepID=UPI00235A9C25|nr:olfactory receptor 1J4-like [Bombina bombina]